MPKFAIAIAMLFLCLASGCSYVPPSTYSVCSTQPGTTACQVEQYNRVD